MRNFYFLPCWLLFCVLPVLAEGRTWTIVREVDTVEGELVAVRGGTAYLRIGERVEQVPLARLSAADHEYLDSLALAPVAPGPAGENELATPMSGPLIVGPTGDILPLPGEERSLVVPASGTAPIGADHAVGQAVGEEGLPQPPGQSLQRVEGSAVQPWVPSAGSVTAPNTQRPAPENPADRRFWRQQQQQQQAQQQSQQQRNNPNANRNNEDEDSRGLRGRLFERRRGAATR